MNGRAKEIRLRILLAISGMGEKEDKERMIMAKVWLGDKSYEAFAPRRAKTGPYDYTCDAFIRGKSGMYPIRSHKVRYDLYKLMTGEKKRCE
jgi:hypothetical protein